MVAEAAAALCTAGILKGFKSLKSMQSVTGLGDGEEQAQNQLVVARPSDRPRQGDLFLPSCLVPLLWEDLEGPLAIVSL